MSVNEIAEGKEAAPASGDVREEKPKGLPRQIAAASLYSSAAVARRQKKPKKEEKS